MLLKCSALRLRMTSCSGFILLRIDDAEDGPFEFGSKIDQECSGEHLLRG